MNISLELMRNIERIEQEAWADMANAAPKPFAQAIGLETAVLGGAQFLMAAKIPQFQFNWLGGAGLNGDDASAIGEAVARFNAAGQKTFIVQIPPGPNASRMEAAATAAGLAVHPLSWAKFVRDTHTKHVVDSSLIIRQIDAGERRLFAETAVAGFGMPAPMATWLAEIVGRPHWHAYVSFDGATPAGAGALYVNGDFAWLGIGATKPDMRKRGGQSALLARRIADAAKFGAKHAVTETGVPQGHAPAPSYQNILRAGFTVAYVRPNWAPRVRIIRATDIARGH